MPRGRVGFVLIVLLVLVLYASTCTTGHPATSRRNRRQFTRTDFHTTELPFEKQLCPVVDCEEPSDPLRCPREIRIPTTFVINGNTCYGCPICPPSASTTTPTTTNTSTLLDRVSHLHTGENDIVTSRS